MLKDFSKEKFDIIIQAGQSNSEGTGFGNIKKPYVPKENVWYMNNDFTISLAKESVNENQIQGNYSLSFADEYIENNLLCDERKILFIRASVGGTGFLDKRWGKNDDLFLRMLEMIKTALNLNSENKLVAFLWHQGETDAILNATYETHFENLSYLLNAVRNRFKCPNLPFVAGDFVQEWKNKNGKICEPVIKAIQNVCKTNEKCAFVETVGLLSNNLIVDYEDIIHFSRESLYILGVRYFDAYKNIL
jgi:hypothetical protein